MQEEWRDIEGYKNYQVSNMGRVKSLGNDKSRKEKILKQRKNNKGYLMVALWKDGKSKTCTVHRLVAQAFIDNPNNHPQVNHKDENKTNNAVSNLEWCTNSYNQKYGNCPKKIGEKNSKRVFQYSLDGTLVGIWQSTMECARNGYNFGAVASCCRKCFNREENNIYKGFIWSYTPIEPI